MKRTSKTAPVLPARVDVVRLGPGRVLRAGGEAKIRLTGRKSLTRAKFLHADERGGLNFTDPRTGGRRTVLAADVVTICRVSKMR